MRLLTIDKTEICSEFLGTFLTVFLCNLLVMKNSDPFSVGLGIFFIMTFFVYANMRFSKAHLNPAVTIAYFILGDLQLAKLIMYSIAQVSASVLAGFILIFFRKGRVTNNLGAPWLKSFDLNGEEFRILNPWQGKTIFILGLILEIVTSGFLMYFIMRVTWDSNIPSNIFGFVIGGYYAVVAVAFGRVTGGGLNPARCIGPSFFSGDIFESWIFILGPILGK